MKDGLGGYVVREFAFCECAVAVSDGGVRQAEEVQQSHVALEGEGVVWIAEDGLELGSGSGLSGKRGKALSVAILLDPVGGGGLRGLSGEAPFFGEAFEVVGGGVVGVDQGAVLKEPVAEDIVVVIEDGEHACGEAFGDQGAHEGDVIVGLEVGVFFGKDCVTVLSGRTKAWRPAARRRSAMRCCWLPCAVKVT